MLRYLALFIHLSVSASFANELSFLGGGLVASEPREHTYTWAIDYRHALSEHFAISGSWINEGHVTNHHRDGAALQIWAQMTPLDPSLSLSVGVGPYYYFDTTDISGDSREVDSHKAGLIYSFAVTRRVAGSWLLHFRANRVNTRSSIDTTSFMVGVGYDLDAHPADPSAASPWDEGTESEIAVMLGTTIVNSFEPETSFAKSIHYRRRLGRHLHGSIG